MVSLGSPRTGDEEIDAVSSLLSRGELSAGSMVEEFEDSFSDFVGTTSAAAVCSGSVALELALEVSDLQEGDTVITSPFNCSAILYSLLRQNLNPVFCDIRTDSYNISPDFLEERLHQQDVQGILLTHLYGQPSEMESITSLARSHDLTVINDFAQSPGAMYDGRDIGTYGDLGVCSFGATKNITTAEGGIVVSDDKNHIDLVKKLRSNTNEDSGKVLRSVRMNDIEAAIGLKQLEKYDDILAEKRNVATYYRNNLTSEVILPETRPNRTNVYHGFPIRTPQNTELMRHLSENGVESSIVYENPLYTYSLAPQTDHSRFTHTELVSEEVLLLPIHSNLSSQEVEKVVSAVNSYFC